MTTPDPAQAWLERYLVAHGGVAGTVHRVVADGGLALAAAVNIPPPVAEVVRYVPRGKGMAGLALEQDQPIATCNIKDDKTGRVRPGAKAVNAQAAVALPVHDATGAVRAVVGIAWQDDRELAESQLAALGVAASAVP
jgi:hypothetical protein